jgi:glycosyltransferase involved in cell wall biosynthesis
MRVLFIHPSPHLTGAGRVLALLAKHLRRRGHETLVAVPSAGPLTRVHAEDLDPVVFVPMAPLRRSLPALARHLLEFSGTVRRLERLIRAWRPDLVHINGIYTLWAGIAARRARAPCLYHVHEARESYPPWLYRIWQEMVARWASRVVLVHGRLREAWARVATRLVVIENGVDVERIRARARDPRAAEWRRAWGAPRSLILCPSHIMPGKNQRVLLCAAPMILRHLPEAGIVFLGRTHERASNEAYRRELQRLARALGIEGRVRFAEVPEDAHSAYGAADLIVSTSPVESFGLIPLEALAAGKPVVSVRTAIAEQLQAHGYAVRVVDRDDPEGLARAVVELLAKPRSDPERAFPPAYRAERVAEDFEALYAHMLAEWNSAPP